MNKLKTTTGNTQFVVDSHILKGKIKDQLKNRRN